MLPEKESRNDGEFATTRWSIVAAAADRSAPGAEAALTALCQTYWYPVYLFVRRRGSSNERAEDLTQSFFQQLIEKESIRHVRPSGARFRSFLLKAVTNFLNNAHRFEAAQKRGGGRPVISLDVALAANKGAEPVSGQTPEAIFERQWALTVLQKSRERLAEEFSTPEQQAFFEAASPILAGLPVDRTYSSLADSLQMTESALKVAVHRLKRRYADVLRSLIAETVAAEEDVDDEIAYLMAALRK